MIFSGCQTKLTTILVLNNSNIDQVQCIKSLGLWITQDLSWQLNCEQMCRKAYARLSLITKLKYAGIQREDLIDVYKLFIRSCITQLN